MRPAAPSPARVVHGSCEQMSRPAPGVPARTLPARDEEGPEGPEPEGEMEGANGL